MSEAGIVTAKAVAMVVLGGASAVLGLTPLAISVVSRRRSKAAGGGEGGRLQLASSPRAALLISLLLAFGGGALLCTTFLHMLPEVREAVEDLQATGGLSETAFHLPEMLMCAGFFAMYLVEELVHMYLHYRRRRASPDGVACGPGAHDADAALHRTLSKRRCSRADASCPPSVAGSAASVVCPDAEAANDPERQKAMEEVRGAAAALQAKLGSQIIVPPPEEDGAILNNSSQQLLQDPSKAKVQPHVVLNGKDAKAHGHAHGHAHHAHGHPHAHLHHGHAHVHLHLEGVDGEDRNSVLSSLRGLLIVLALSVHELFEGLAVGLQETAELVYYLMGAVAAHKLVLAFCVGVQLMAAGTRSRLVVAYVLTFALVSPIGIGVGLALGVERGNSVETGAATTTLQGLACGTLLYVVFFEILQRDAKGIWQLGATAAGFLLMFGLLHVARHEHSHGHDHAHDHEGDQEKAVTSILLNQLLASVAPVTAAR